MFLHYTRRRFQAPAQARILHAIHPPAAPHLGLAQFSPPVRRDPFPRWKFSVLASRLLAATLILTPLLALVAADYWLSGSRPGIWLLPVLLLVSLAAAHELADLLSAGGPRVAPWVVLCGVAGVLAAACFPILWGDYPADCLLGRLGWPLAALVIALFAVFAVEMRRYESPGEAVPRIAATFFAIAYIALPMAFFPSLRAFHGNNWGMAACVSVILIAKTADTGAYIAGKNFGRRKMAPRLSPGKTWEGAAGGMLAAVLVSWAYFALLVPWWTGTEPIAGLWWRAPLYGLLLGAAGMLGDLGESLLKRDRNRKDSSHWLPGLGGVLDMLDSLLPAVPLAYLCWVGGLLGPAAAG